MYGKNISMDKKEIISNYKRGSNDVGSPEVQIALATARIQHLAEHAKVHKKDKHSRRGLIAQVEKRKKLLSYLKKSCEDRYKAILVSLNLRK
jgi:small subunit ribosomal protein S15